MQIEGKKRFERINEQEFTPEFIKNIEQSKLTPDDKLNIFLTKGRGVN